MLIDSKTAVVWTLSPQRLNPSLLWKSCLAWLDPHELQHIHTLANNALRHDYLAAHALCRAALATITGQLPADLQIVRDASGKPRLATNAAVHFNLTHTQGLAAVIISNAGPVGLDAEWTARPVNVEQLARHFFSRAARLALDALPDHARLNWFYEQWVLHEALLKGQGQGIAEGLQIEPLQLDASTQSIHRPPWRLQLFWPSQSHLLAAAVGHDFAGTIELRRGEELFEAGVAVVE